MGLLDPDDWVARWIRAPRPDTLPDEEGIMVPAAAPLMRTHFALDESPLRARAYVTALGLYELRINGTKVGDQVLAPGWTNYHRRIQYQTFDVTGMLAVGENALGVILGRGWYSGHVASLGPYFYGDFPAALVQLEVQTANGGVITAATDATWRTASSGIRSDDLLIGEQEDAAAWPTGWDRPGFDDRGWDSVRLHAGTGGELVSQVDTGTKVVKTLRPIQVTGRDGVSIVDLGQNMVGHVRLDLDCDAGTEVRLRHAEVLRSDGDLYTGNLLTAQQRDTYLTREGSQSFEPRFTSHGFRYVEISGLDQPIEEEHVTGAVVSADLESTGRFSCSDPMLNQLQRNIVWGQRGNFISVPTDCPQRNERLGWTGDAQVFAATAAFNMNVLPFLRKWLIDLEDAQRPSGAYPDVAPGGIFGIFGGVGNAGWEDAGIIVPWCLYVRYGVTDVLEHHYAGMRRYLAYLRANSTGYVRSAGRYGDWLSLEGPTPMDVIGTAFFAHSAHLLGMIAGVLGDDDGRAECEVLRSSIREAFIESFVEDDGAIAGHTQVGHILALHMGLVPEDLRAATAELLARDIRARGHHIVTGFLGTRFALPVLSEHGYHELACRVAQQDSFPSWGFQIKHGATTPWERWDGWTPEHGFREGVGNSFNHYAFGSIGDWLYRYIGGLEPDPEHPGYGHARVHPRPGGSLRWSRLSYDSRYGRWKVHWELVDGQLALDVVVPANATADIVLPANATAIRYGHDHVAPPDGATVRDDPHGTSVHVGSGRYGFRSPLPLNRHI
jgi:alpha-L-rhamnosidase